MNAHLAAHDHMLEERIKDYEKIVEEHKFHVKTTTEIFTHEYSASKEIGHSNLMNAPHSLSATFSGSAT